MNLNNCNFKIKQILNSLFISALILIVISLSGNVLAQKSKEFRDSSCITTAKPLQVFKGEKVVIQCDTAFLINSYRYQLYEKAKNYLIRLAGNASKMDFNQVEGSYNQLDTYFSEIQSRYFLLSEEMKKQQTESAATLQRVNNELDQTITDLQTTKKDLAIISESLKKARKKELKNRLIFGGGCFAAGIILGALLIH